MVPLRPGLHEKSLYLLQFFLSDVWLKYPILKASTLVVTMRPMACAAIIFGAGFGDGIHRAITIPKCALGLFSLSVMGALQDLRVG
jgi:hypothetical protein